MSTSRAESVHSSHHGRRRSNTTQSILRGPPQPPAPALRIGDHKTLHAWVHDPKDTPNVIINPSWWPGVSDGDMISVSGQGDGSSSFLFIVHKYEGPARPQLQISIPRSTADACGLRNNGEVLVTKVDRNKWCADYVELTFQDQYLGRNDMWRLGQHLVGQCVHTNQEISFIGSIAAKIQNIYINGKKVSSAFVTSTTKSIYRSLSARVTIFIQVCHELWEFAGDGERYNEKIVHSFLPALFSKWREAGTNHTVSIVLISRVFYDKSEIAYAAGPLRQDDRGYWYKDFFKVITDLEVIYDWKPTLVSLKDSFWDFQRDILLTHHYHRAYRDSGVGPAEPVRLVGRLSYAHDGPLLEALNLGLNPTEHHYIDRSLSLTGAATMVITPGTGFYRVSKHLLRLTTIRMLDQGFGLDLVSLAKPPLHQSPIFTFRGPDVDGRVDSEKTGLSVSDPLWGRDDDTRGNTRMKTYWWEPFWISISFWDKQMDLPFREDRFVARAKVHQIQMLGLLEHDVLSSIEVPFLKTRNNGKPDAEEAKVTKEEAEKFDNDIFTTKPDSKRPVPSHRTSTGSSTSTLIPPPLRPSEKRHPQPHRNPIMTSRIAPIEESPRTIIKELPPEGPENSILRGDTGNSLSTSPSKMSVHSVSSTSSLRGQRSQGANRSSLASRLTPSWLFNPFRSTPSEPQTTQIIASGSPTQAKPTPISTSPKTVPVQIETPPKPPIPHVQSPMPMAIKNTPGNRSHLSRAFEDETYIPHRTALHHRRSPMNTPPMDDSMISKRWSVTSSNLATSAAAAMSTSFLSSSPGTFINPTQPQKFVPHSQASLARRWQHMFPRVTLKHEIKWKSMVTPGCLPLTVEYFPTIAELESSYDMFSYDFVVDPGEMKSFLVKPPPNIRNVARVGAGGSISGGGGEEVRRAWALAVMRGMAAVRLAQGFQFVLRPKNHAGVHGSGSLYPKTGPQGAGGTGAAAPGGGSGPTGSGGGSGSGSGPGGSTLTPNPVPPGATPVPPTSTPSIAQVPTSTSIGDGDYGKPGFRRTKSYNPEDGDIPKPGGAAEVLRITTDTVWLSMTNEIHRISYTGETIQVRRYVRRMPDTLAYKYQCLIWPKLGGGYTEVSTSFSPHGLEDYGWNRLDMLVAGYERQFNESIRYWRTRFIVIPTLEPPEQNIGPGGEKLNDEEMRMIGIEKLAEQFSKHRWLPPEEKAALIASTGVNTGSAATAAVAAATAPIDMVRILPTTLDPAASVLDESLMEQLDQIHASGPLRKKIKSEKEIGDMTLAAIAKAMMKEEDGVPIKFNQWHTSKYPHSFTGAEFVSWVVREFRDVSSRAQGTEVGVKLLEQGLFEHCRRQHGFLDGHYFYRLKGEFAIPMTPRGWFARRLAPGEDRGSGHYPSSVAKPKKDSPRRTKKRIILSQSMPIDIDPNKKSDQAESVILHHDIIHNPANVFHFELQWIGTTARCIEDLIRQWSKTIDKYGLKLVEAYVAQIADVRERNAFQSCFPLRLAVPPPIVPDLEKRVPEGVSTAKYFEYAILKKFGFIMDVEAGELYPEQVEAVYSYRKLPFKYSQFVHRSGVAFVQVLGGVQGFLFLTNRLMGPGRMMHLVSAGGGGLVGGGGGGGGGKAIRWDYLPAVRADEIRSKLQEFCSDAKRLNEFYDEELANLGHVPEEPPPLSI
ncbi:hypothetical protein AX16_007038 [Volvariella volvacea WC 439]|nr:hypothetical protein AX16_007038 [Volvariella volvacea WC 439]